MMQSRLSIFFLSAMLLGSSASPGSADPTAKAAEMKTLLPHLDSERIEELLTRGELSHMIETDEGPLLVPGDDLRRLITGDLEAIDYTTGVEVLNIIPGDYDDFDTVAAANLLLELSTLEGLEYYSASRERMRTLFVQSYAIDSAENERRVDDPFIEEAPGGGSVIMFQEDMTFGKNKLRIAYNITPSTIHMVTENITTFSWGPVPLIKPGNLRLHALVYRGDNFTLYYGSFGAKAIRIGILEKRIYNSFYNRLVALYGWFQAKLSSSADGAAGGRIY
ncbi:MAG: hypothetical protein JW852_04180 [Spirochaetales bacterium]|nr:hypothetical protein [Spirochaetales bacterium]